MKRAFLAIADDRRLLTLLPEVGGAIRLARQLTGRFSGSRCYWVVLEDEGVSLVQYLLDEGEPEVALWVLQQQSFESGPADFSGSIEQRAA